MTSIAYPHFFYGFPSVAIAREIDFFGIGSSPVRFRNGSPSATCHLSRSGSIMHRQVLETAHQIATQFLDGVASRHVGGATTRAALLDALGGPLPRTESDPVDVLKALAANADPGIVASAGPRYFGFVTGGAVPVTVAADWLASTWDQNPCLDVLSPAVAAIEEIVAGWILELLRFPHNAGVGFVTGCHMANFTCLAAARHEVLRRAGWDVETHGLQRAPRVRVIAGNEVHISAVGALRYLGFGSEEIELVPVDDQGRMRADALEVMLGKSAGRRSCARRPVTSARAPAILSRRSSRARTPAAHGCTSTARSVSGQPPFRSCDPKWRGSRRRTHGRPMRTNGSTSRTTRASPSLPPPLRIGRR